jgi:hypothetical protein
VDFTQEYDGFVEVCSERCLEGRSAMKITVPAAGDGVLRLAPFINSLYEMRLDHRTYFKPDKIVIFIQFDTTLTKRQAELGVKVLIGFLRESQIMKRPMVAKIPPEMVGARSVLIH